MPAVSIIKTNRLTVYMIKPEYQRINDIIDSPNEPQTVGDVGKFAFEESHPHQPEWVNNFFGDRFSDLRILTSSAKGIFIVPIERAGNVINFAVSFGVGRHLLKEGVAEERFGLKVVLNSVEQESFRSIDKTTLGSVPKHSREQMSRDVTPSDFGIDIEQDLISSVTAKSRDERLGKIITGRDALHLSVKVDRSNIVDFLSHCLERYRSNDYKTNFDWIDQIAEIRNSILEGQLNEQLLELINRNELEKIWMAVPEVINWSDISCFRYIRAKNVDPQDDLDLEKFIQAFGGRQIQIEDLKGSDVFAISARNDETIFRWSAFRCIYAEVDLGGKTYVLNNGKWYEIAQSFTEQVERDFAGINDATIILPDYGGGDEFAYNTRAAAVLPNACCMDQELIMHGGGHNKVEFCDVLTGNKKIVHVKKYGGSSVLNHLFAQGVLSGELFVSDEEFRVKLNHKLPRGYKLTNARTRPNPAEYEIVYAIITKSTGPLEIPFFSKVSLRNARRRLASYGYTVTKKKILKIDPS